ncbi:MAG: hypothetical protein JW923_07805 [Spirochaetales bacterium]|nr:hypothetical protein [Spirochaetales bacterium]
MKRAPIGILIASTLFMSAGSAWSQEAPEQTWETEPAWLHFEQGKRAYEDKDFGKALVSFDRAIATRRGGFAQARSRLQTALSSQPAKTAGDSIGALMDAFAAEDFLAKDYLRIVADAGDNLKARIRALKASRLADAHRAFLDCLTQVMEYRPVSELNDSLKALGQAIALLSAYPEAEFWKGKIFALEGEYSLALIQYDRAWDQRESLEVPEERYAILYAKADLYGARGELASWESTMDYIIKDEELYSEPSIDPALIQAMSSSILGNDFDHFMTLYRLKAAFSLEANSALSEFYLERGRQQAYIRAAIAANMVVTAGIALVSAWDTDYSWAGLDDFLDRAYGRRDIAEFLDGQKLYRKLLILADALYVAGGRGQARALWLSLAERASGPERAVASRRLSNPESALPTVSARP